VHDTRNTAIYFREASTHGTVRNCVVYNAGRNADAGDNGPYVSAASASLVQRVPDRGQ